MLSLTVFDNPRRRRRAPRLGAPSFGYQNTTVTNDLAADGYSWAQAKPIVVDKHGNIITIAQRQNEASKRHFFVWSANGAVWTDNPSNTGHDSQPGEAFFERGAAAYDPDQDTLHVLWITTNPGDGGVIYRAYDIAYSGTTITAINRRVGVSVVLDGTDADQNQHPVMLFLGDAAFGAHGGLLACWAIRKSGENEVRAAMCSLGSSGTTGGTASNWTHIGVESTDTLGVVPATASYTALVVNATDGICYPSLGRKAAGTHALDLYLLYNDGSNTPSINGNWRWRRMAWASGSNNWAGGLTTDTLITAAERAGDDTGYSLKNQLGTAWAEDTDNDRMVAGLPTWKDDTTGDTWSFVGVDDDDSLDLIDVYSAGGAHSFAPVGDVCYDATSQRIVVSWLTSGTEHARVQLYSGLTAVGDALTAYSAVSPSGVDIPLLYPRWNGKLLVLFRDRVDQSGAALYRGLIGTLTWS